MEFNLRRGRALAGGKAGVGGGGARRAAALCAALGAAYGRPPQSRPKDGLPCGPQPGGLY